uniref:Uncharacterized protein n=1 Tax=Anguilla anguilla TaxID=7936 RepID=A0A0E9SQV3_ANGAN
MSCSCTIEYTLLPPNRAYCYLIFKLKICLKIWWPRSPGRAS